jgi:hypothetical protein
VESDSWQVPAGFDVLVGVPGADGFDRGQLHPVGERPVVAGGVADGACEVAGQRCGLAFVERPRPLPLNVTARVIVRAS